MEGSIEQMYPRSRQDYEFFVDKVFREVSRHTFDKKKKGSGMDAVSLLNAVLEQALAEASPEEVKELAKVVDEQCNKKIEAHNKDIGKTKSKLKGIKMYADGDGDFSHLEHEGDDVVDEEEIKRQAKLQEEREAKDKAAQEELARKQAESAELRSALKKEERKVAAVDLAAMGFQPMKKKDDDFGFGGKKKGKKK